MLKYLIKLIPRPFPRNKAVHLKCHIYRETILMHGSPGHSTCDDFTWYGPAFGVKGGLSFSATKPFNNNSSELGSSLTHGWPKLKEENRVKIIRGFDLIHSLRIAKARRHSNVVGWFLIILFAPVFFMLRNGYDG